MIFLVTSLLLAFTDPSGSPIWIAKDQITAIAKPAGCFPGSQTKVITGAGNICIREPLEQVVKTFEDTEEDK